MKQLTRIVDYEVLEDRVYKAIKESIVTQSIRPGSRLWADRLSKDLGVSRTPVQVALVRLENEGLVKNIPRRGTYVTVLSLGEIRNLYALREVLEGLAARQAAKHITADFLGELSSLRARFEAFRSQALPDVLDAYLRADVELHSSIVRASGNDRLIHILATLSDVIEMLKLRSVTLRGRVEKSLAQHLLIIDALMRGDPDAAERFMWDHIISVRGGVEEAMRKDPSLLPQGPTLATSER